MRSFVKIFFITVLIWSLSGCKPPAAQHSKELPPVPETFSLDSLDAGASIKPWRVFFEDSLLVNLIGTAIDNNPDLLMAIQRVEIARADQKTARAGLLPTLSAGGFTGQRKFGKYTMDGVGNYDTNFSPNITSDMHVPDPYPDHYIGLQSSWEIDLWGRLRGQRRAAIARFEASEKGRYLVTTVLVSAVAHLYYHLLMLDEMLEIIHENIELQKRASDIVEIQKAVGAATELAAKQFEAQLLGTRSLEGTIRQSITEAENTMNLLLGRFPQPVKRSAPILQQSLPARLSAGVPSQALARRPDIQQAELELVAAKADVSAARAAYYPMLTITANVGQQSFITSELLKPTSISYNLFAGLTGPIFNRFAVQSAHRKSTAMQEQAIQHYHKSVLTAYSEVVTSLSKINNMRDVSSHKEAQVRVLRESVTTANDLYRGGYASYLEVVVAQRVVITAELELIETRNKQFDAMIELYRSLGGGWE